jgi:quinoprotein glucose dehydrogenase
MRTLLALLFTSALALSADEVDTPKPSKKNKDRDPKGNAAMDTAEGAMKNFAVAPGLKVDVWASEPLLENPIALSFDAQGRAFVAVTQRRRTSVPDIRKHEDWQVENFSLRTVEDRIAFLKAKMPESPARKPKKPEEDINKDGQLDWRDWAVESEEIRIVEDSTGSGRADKSRVLASGFNSLETGLGAGVLAMPDGGAIYTCAPDLWRIAPDGTKTKLATGFGVHVAFGGHDMHGVKMGPDGRIYFTIADCGAHVVSKEGKAIEMPDSGAVYRCWPNGDALELYAWGLRNPQCLAFNDVGDLFTGDNNADGGDKARWIHVVEGADYGWRIGWQFLPKLGAWNSEGMWHLDVAETNAAILPPVAHITHGPAGISHYPGTGLPEKYRDHFFVADFPGGVRHFALKQKGASYEVDGMAGDDRILQNNSPSEMRNKLLWNLYPSDVQFPPGGGVCVLDWVYGWEKTGKGRIYRVHDPVVDASAAVQETKKLLAEGMSKRTPEELAKLLGHVDQRVRLAAQFALAENDYGSLFLAQETMEPDLLRPGVTTALLPPLEKLKRLHGIWGLAQLSHRQQSLKPSLLSLGTDADPEVRAQWAKAVGETRLASESAMFIHLLNDPEPRVQFFAAQSLGKLKAHHATEALFSVLKEIAGRDATLRHALVTALAQCADADELSAKQSDASESVRLGALLALRRIASPEVARFLDDKNPQIRINAVRAIHDAPIHAALPKLAALDLCSAGVPPAGSRVSREPSGTTGAQKPKDAAQMFEGRGGDASAGRRDARATRDAQDAISSRLAMLDTALARRVINANYRLGTADSAKRLAMIAANSATAESVRLDALEALAQWPVKLGRDRVLGIVVAGDGQRNASDAAAALAPVAAILLGESNDSIRIAALNAAGANKLTAAAETITMLATNSNASGAVRAASLDALAAMDSPKLGALVIASFESPDKTLAEAARKLAGKISPAAAVKANASVLGKGGLREQQQALATITAETGAEADAVIAQQLDLLLAGKVKAGLVLDLLEAAAPRKDSAIQKKLAAFEATRNATDPLARWRECLEGGESKEGKRIFAEKAEAACMRCHKVKGEGGDVGPDLAEVGKKMGREYVLQSIVDPNAVIAKGYDNIMVTLKNGDIIAGLLSNETADEIALKNPADAKLQRVKKADVKERASLPSAMPPGMGEVLTKRELRDVVQYLSSLK